MKDKKIKNVKGIVKIPKDLCSFSLSWSFSVSWNVILFYWLVTLFHSLSITSLIFVRKTNSFFLRIFILSDFEMLNSWFCSNSSKTIGKHKLKNLIFSLTIFDRWQLRLLTLTFNNDLRTFLVVITRSYSFFIWIEIVESHLLNSVSTVIRLNFLNKFNCEDILFWNFWSTICSWEHSTSDSLCFEMVMMMMMKFHWKRSSLDSLP